MSFLLTIAFAVYFFCTMDRAFADKSRIRLTETSITETGRFSHIPEVRVQTKGYGFSYIHTSGVGIGLSKLTTRSVNADLRESVDSEHRHLEVSYTSDLGDWFAVTAGAAWGIGGRIQSIKNGIYESSAASSSQSVFVGPGIILGFLEIYWIYRRNWVEYRLEQETTGLRSQHYQLGVAVRF